MLASTTFGDLTTIEKVLVASGYVIFAQGLAISYIAYRGWRRNDSRAMLLIAIGFILTVGVTGAIQTLVMFFGIGDRIVASVIIYASQIVGMSCILWALWKG